MTTILVKLQVQTTPQPYAEDDDYFAFKAILFQYNTDTRCEDHIDILCLVSTDNQKLLGVIKSQTVMRLGRIMGALATPWVCAHARAVPSVHFWASASVPLSNSRLL